MKNNRFKGFTLIELIVVFAIFFITASVGMVKFSQFTTSQILDSTARDISAFLNSARNNAVSQRLIAPCTQDLKMYSVKFITPQTYQLYVYCNNSSYPLDKVVSLPTEVKFDSSTSQQITFLASSGFSSGGKIVLKGAISSKTINIDSGGNITQQ